MRDTENAFARRGARVLLVAKFVPALQTVAPPLAGMIRMRFFRFFLFDLAGTLWWSITFVGLGYVLHDELERVTQLAMELGGWLVVIVLAAASAYLLGKYVRRRRFIRSLWIARIEPEELRRKLEKGEEIEIVDLRHSLDFAAEPDALPGARRIPADQIDARHHEIPRDRDVVLYCSCPNEASSARIALLLKRRGIDRVRPLAGGRDRWLKLGFPVERLDTASADETTK